MKHDIIQMSENSANFIGTVKSFDSDGFFWIETKRLSGVIDTIRCKMAEGAKDVLLPFCDKYPVGTRVDIIGKLRSYAVPRKVRDQLCLFVEVIGIKAAEEDVEDTNHICITGWLTKDVRTRTTPMGRTIANMFVALQSEILENGKCIIDTIPCISWGRVAVAVEKHCKKDTFVSLTGRLQERHYTKTTENNEKIDVFVHELSCSHVDF